MAWVLAAGLPVWGCGDRAAVPVGAGDGTARATQAAPSAPPPAVTSTARVHPSLPPFVFALAGDGPEDPTERTIRVRRLEIRREGETAPFQAIDGLETETPMPASGSPLEVLDMNFDGYADIRLVAFRAPGPSIPYVNWLFDPLAGRFVSSPALDEIPSASFDPATREIRSEWRDGAATYGRDVYGILNGTPVPVRREVREYSRPGRYTLRVSTYADGAWRVAEEREGQDP
jgi:hypothetical protein